MSPQARSCGGGSDADRRRALALLAGPRDSCTEAIMLAHGFTVDQMVELVSAPAKAERIVGGTRDFEIARMWITDAGLRVLVEARR